MARQLGKSVVEPAIPAVKRRATPVNTRTALWAERWPAIALQVCIDEVEAAPPDQQAAVKRALPCQECEAKTRCLTAKRKEIGPLIYDREILTKPRSSESSLFPRSLFEPMLNTSRGMMPFYVKPASVAKYELVVSGWDLAWSEKTGGDHLVRCTGVLDTRTMRKRLINIKRYPQGMRYTQQVQLMKQDYQRFRDDLVVVESDAAQVIWAQALEEGTDMPVYRHSASDKQDLQVGVPGLLIDFDAQRWDFPCLEGAPGFEDMEVLFDEFEAFGWRDGKLEGVGEHDDTVMAFFHMSHGMRMFGQMTDEWHAGNQPGRSE